MLKKQTHANGGVFICEECKKQCNIVLAVSNCCLMPIICPPERFPFICTGCNGDCELGDPSTPTHEEQVGTAIMNTLKAFKDDKMTDEEAWSSIANIMKREIDSHIVQVAEGIQHDVNNVEFPQAKSHEQHMMICGYDLARHVVDSIVDDLKKEV